MGEGNGKGEEQGNGYEQMLWNIAGRPVPTGRIVLVWAACMAVIVGFVYLAGGRTDGPYYVVFGLFSAPYWGIAVPEYVRRKYRHNKMDDEDFDDNP